MPNMSYCRFHNTAQDLRDCLDHVDDELSEGEHKARVRMVRHCAHFLRNAGVDISDDQIKAAVEEVEGWQ